VVGSVATDAEVVVDVAGETRQGADCCSTARPSPDGSAGANADSVAVAAGGGGVTVASVVALGVDFDVAAAVSAAAVAAAAVAVTVVSLLNTGVVLATVPASVDISLVFADEVGTLELSITAQVESTPFDIELPPRGLLLTSFPILSTRVREEAVTALPNGTAEVVPFVPASSPDVEVSSWACSCSSCSSCSDALGCCCCCCWIGCT